jgi:predicted MFS family arabinose efflux permease
VTRLPQTSSDSDAAPEKLFTREFTILCVINFLVYSNVALFFQFHTYLAGLNIPAEWFGFLISVFSVTALILRPLAAPFIHDGNARVWLLISCIATIFALLGYNLAGDVASMTIIRIVHGAGFVVLGIAAITKLVGCIPESRSGQAFGLVSVVMLVPYAFVPPLIKPLIGLLGGFDQILTLSAVIMALSLPFILMLDRGRSDAAGSSIFSLAEIKENLSNFKVFMLLFVSFLVWTSFTMIFYFIKGFGDELKILNPGWFLTVATIMEISVRVVAGKYLDKFNKNKQLLLSLIWLAVGYVGLTQVTTPAGFYVFAVILGLGWSVVFPVMNGYLFESSSPRFRALNQNLAAEMYQAGFSIGPLAGGFLLIKFGFSALFYAGALFLFAGVIAVITLCQNK